MIVQSLFSNNQGIMSQINIEFINNHFINCYGLSL